MLTVGHRYRVIYSNDLCREIYDENFFYMGSYYYDSVEDFILIFTKTPYYQHNPVYDELSIDLTETIAVNRIKKIIELWELEPNRSEWESAIVLRNPTI